MTQTGSEAGFQPLSWIRLFSLTWRWDPQWTWWCTHLIPALGRQRQVDLWVQDQPVLHNEFQDSQNYIVRPCLKKTTNPKTKKMRNQPMNQPTNQTTTTTTKKTRTWQAHSSDAMLSGLMNLQQLHCGDGFMDVYIHPNLSNCILEIHKVYHMPIIFPWSCFLKPLWTNIKCLPRRDALRDSATN